MNSRRATLPGPQTPLQSRPSTILVQLKRSSSLLMMPSLRSTRCSLALMTLRRHWPKMRVLLKLNNKRRTHRENNSKLRLSQLKQPNLVLQLLNLMQMEMLSSSQKLLLPQLSQLKLMCRLLKLVQQLQQLQQR